MEESAAKFKIADKAALKIGVIVLICLASFVYLAKFMPNEKEVCNESCATQGKHGEVSYVLSKEQTAGMRGRGPTQCRCLP